MSDKRNGSPESIQRRQEKASDDPLSLGCLLASAGVAIEAIQQALETQRERSDEMLGHILVENGVITAEYLDLMLRKQKALRSGSTSETIGILRTVAQKLAPPRAEHQRLRDMALYIAHMAGRGTR